jgi:thiol-disulfide isomerase/thioredoxin
MAVSSFMVPLGSPMPEFALSDVDGNEVKSSELGGRALLVVFLSNHCPYVRHVEDGLAAFAAEYAGRGVDIVAISSNDAGVKPEDGVDGLRKQVARTGFAFPYLLDTTQEVAKEFRAACTPDFFLYDADRRLAYRGAFDTSRPNSGIPVTGELLRAAVDRVLAGEAVPEPHTPSVGCSIKWAPGNEPEITFH